MKSMARVWRRHYPLVMRLVQRLVDERMVQATMDPVNEKVGKADKEGELDDVVKCKGGVRGRVVEFSVTADFTKEKRHGEDGHEGKRYEGLFDLKPNLVFEVLRVCEGSMVEDEDIG